jgi:DNA-binding transcriptional ArsR family regulator
MFLMADDASFKALANSTRRSLLRLVRDESRTVGALVAELGVSQPAVSQHLAVLRDARLVSVEVDGRRRLYRADLATIAEVREFFDGYWVSAVDRLATAAERDAPRRRSAS